MWDQNSLAGKRVVVTAGGSGIGLEIASAFLAGGSKVLVKSNSDGCRTSDLSSQVLR